ncbi:HIRAN domain-containing protein [Rhodospira trueperi]|uniref:HIRAN domain-containing protein n=1 Tax=Rhodospira trueperi TaxID=69960 RepID=A0A1G7CCW2_9PROT|nr:HIRAN domain-containing protein [Rhodospira trueperi]SDE37212.1 HIRAN domain-containing protein [Rhodospira trueperi]
MAIVSCASPEDPMRPRLSRRRLFGWVALGLSCPNPRDLAVLLPRRPRPASARPLTLMETFVAGTAYYEAEMVAPTLRPGDRLTLRREPDNRFDALAIEVFTARGEKLGYVPRADNPPFTALMDDGHTLVATVLRVREGWRPDISFRIAVTLPAGGRTS